MYGLYFHVNFCEQHQPVQDDSNLTQNIFNVLSELSLIE